MTGGPKVAMVLAAGLGMRMRPLTLETPKPLLPVAGRSLLDRALDHVSDAGIERAVVNVHWLADQVIAAVDRRDDIDIAISDETSELLETGGGLVKARSHLGEGGVIVVNADILWTDGPHKPALARLLDRWDDRFMDGLLLLHHTDKAHGYDGAGDFFLHNDSRLQRRGDCETAPYVFAGVQILHTRLFDGAPDGPFSLNVLYDEALAKGRLYGLVHDGSWYHVGTPHSLEDTDALLRKK